ncbi:WXG100 family type VII secretion target [Dactylosporangium sp. NBC_01737]|uniref:WXG100 family type VII secretion target n=1 Tax=Dactylosporangium sp. NBC_01737 TaxID=2975959 RepID=UPI002E138940|nr:WXG100 family type VII secretion target [Dactylosporangium sp. NBC_01737]
MDALDRLAGIGTDLLHRVDAALVAGGAPVGDPLWPLLRLVGALPGDALEFGLKLTPQPLRSAAAQLRADADRFARRRDRLAADLGPAAGAWEGAGAEAFAARWQSLAGHLGDGADPATVTGRLRATASYADALADWSEGLRTELAEAVAGSPAPPRRSRSAATGPGARRRRRRWRRPRGSASVCSSRSRTRSAPPVTWRPAGRRS